jgi:hypothetical protein
MKEAFIWEISQMEHGLGKLRPSTDQILKILYQNSTASGNIKYWLDIDRFTSYCKTLWSVKNYGTQDWNFNRKNNYEGHEIKRE